MQAVSVIATVPGAPKPGIGIRYDSKLHCKVVAMDKRAIPLDNVYPPVVEGNRILAASYRISKAEGYERFVLTGPTADDEDSVLMSLVLPCEHQFVRNNHRKILLRNKRKNSSGLILVAEPGLLIRAFSRKLDTPQYVYVTAESEVMFASRDEVGDRGAFH